MVEAEPRYTWKETLLTPRSQCAKVLAKAKMCFIERQMAINKQGCSATMSLGKISVLFDNFKEKLY